MYPSGVARAVPVLCLLLCIPWESLWCYNLAIFVPSVNSSDSAAMALRSSSTAESAALARAGARQSRRVVGCLCSCGLSADGAVHYVADVRGAYRMRTSQPIRASTRRQIAQTGNSRTLLWSQGLRHMTRGSCAGVADAATNFDAVESWGEVLSVGEQQRVAFLRLLRAAPALAFLDEATSAMDTTTEKNMYTLLRRHCGSFVSIGHRPQLEAYHSHVLQWVSPGQWRLRPSTMYDGGDSGVGAGGHSDAS